MICWAFFLATLDSNAPHQQRHETISTCLTRHHRATLPSTGAGDSPKHFPLSLFL